MSVSGRIEDVPPDQEMPAADMADPPRSRSAAAIDATDGLEQVPSDREMPTGEMSEPESLDERAEMPDGSMEAGA